MMGNATSAPSSAPSPSAPSAPLNNTSASEVINATGDNTTTIISGLLIAGIAGGVLRKMNLQNKELEEARARNDAENSRKAQTKARGAETRRATLEKKAETRLDSFDAKDAKSYSVPRNSSNGMVTRATADGVMHGTLPGTNVTYEYPKGGNDNNKSRIGGKRRTRKHKKYITKRQQLRKIRRTGKKRHRNSKKFRMNK